MFEKLSKCMIGVAVFSIIFVLSTFMAAPAQAQVSGATLSGLLTDESGGAVANATVSIKNKATGVVREVTTNSDGFYSAPNLLPGNYEVTVTATGFSTVVQKDITLTVGGQQALNLSLKVGQVSTTVEVSAAPPDVQTTSSTIGATVDSATVRELPLNGRDWTSLATLEPGVSNIPNQVGTGFSANKGNRGFGNQLSNSGHRANENTYRVNGISINDYSNGAPGGASGLNLGVDGIQEFSVLTSDYTAEYGEPPARLSTPSPRAVRTISMGLHLFSIATRFSMPRIILIRQAPSLLSVAFSLEGPAERRSLRTRPLFMAPMKAYVRTGPDLKPFTSRRTPSGPWRSRPSLPI